MILAACDPGLNGGIVVRNRSFKIRTRKDVVIAFEYMNTISNALDDDIVLYIEKVHSMPHDGKAAIWTFAGAVEMIHMAAAIYGFKTVLVTPQKWQSKLGCKDDKSGLSASERKLLAKTKKKRLQQFCWDLYGRKDIYQWECDAWLIMKYAELMEIDEEF